MYCVADCILSMRCTTTNLGNSPPVQLVFSAGPWGRRSKPAASSESDCCPRSCLHPDRLPPGAKHIYTSVTTFPLKWYWFSCLVVSVCFSKAGLFKTGYINWSRLYFTILSSRLFQIGTSSGKFRLEQTNVSGSNTHFPLRIKWRPILTCA